MISFIAPINCYSEGINNQINIVELIKNGSIKVYDSSEILDFDTIPQMHNDQNFIRAFNELSKMLYANSYNLKKAVFIVEKAYDNTLNYDSYCSSIDSTVFLINRYIDQIGIRQYQTCVNAALFEYFTKSNFMNKNRPFKYDFMDPGGRQDITKLFVSKLMKTHSGQCQSFPFYYKVLCNELGVMLL